MTPSREVTIVGGDTTPICVERVLCPVATCKFWVYERQCCLTAGLVKGEGFAVDASVMEANASRYHGKAPDEIVWAEPERQTRAVKEYLAALEAEAEPNRERKPPKVISPSDPCAAWTATAIRITGFPSTIPRKSHRKNFLAAEMHLPSYSKALMGNPDSK